MISFQTNVDSLVAQENLNINSQLQSQTIQQLSSGYRINSSGDDAAGLAVANQYKSEVAQLTQGVNNANQGLSQLQIVDGGLSNISQILDRLQTLATESASSTFAGDRSTLNQEYQQDLAEITRQASNINLNAGGTYNTQMAVYIGGANNTTDAQVSIDLSGASNAVDAASLGLASTSVIGGGTSFTGNTVDNLSDSNAVFNQTATTGSTSFSIQYANASGAVQTADVSVAASVDGESGTQFISDLNSAITTAGITGITAQIGTGGDLQFTGGNLLQVTATDTGLVGGSQPVTTATSLLNGANYQTASQAFTDFAAGQAQTLTFTTGGTNYSVTLSNANAANEGNALTALNNGLAGSGIYAVETSAGIAFQGANSFTISSTAAAGGASGSLGAGTAGAVAVNAPTTSASATGNALNAINAIATAIKNLGLVQGAVGAGENKLNYAINLANSQITNFSSAQSQIMDANVAQAAANLTKSQVLEQSTVAAMAQANSEPQAVLKLLQQ